MYSYVARQPILNRQEKTIGYELLFRDGEHNAFPKVESNTATHRLIVDNYFSGGQSTAVASGWAFINFPQQSLEDLVPTLLPKEQIVVEILETCEPSDKLLAAVKHLHKLGYKLALDDFNSHPGWRRFFPYIHIIKMDLREMGVDNACKFVEANRGKKIKFLAEKVENHAVFSQCLAAGFQFFQGYYFAKPEMVKQKRIDVTQMSAMQMLQELCRKPVDFARIEKLVATDLNLSFSLLRYVNASAGGRKVKEITSFKQALVYLGEEKLKQFIGLVTTAQAGVNKPTELIIQSMLRAKICELLASLSGYRQLAEEAFLVGLFSRLDSLLDAPLSDLVGLLPLSQDSKHALLDKQGDLGVMLQITEAFDLAEWHEVDRLCGLLKIKPEAVERAYTEAFKWSKDFETG
uniref:EAL and HDOD domain-containing protein n=1 Tax=Thaumasiovibrio occultus TaxID=1891184 RepID=UPI000B353B1C|nr:EAL domain-containing protein [Thaumasiovibrio occultus]